MSEMNINRNNYESWFMDYLDGRLDAAAEKRLMSFLDFNPDLQKELAGLKEIRLEPGEIDYADKAALRKPSNDPDPRVLMEHFEDYCLAAVERQLSAQEEKILQEIVEQNPEKSMTYRLYQSTILKADERIQYPRKEKVYQPSRVPDLRCFHCRCTSFTDGCPPGAQAFYAAGDPC